MKKQIALIIISMLAVMPVSAQNVKCNQNVFKNNDCEKFMCPNVFDDKDGYFFDNSESVKFNCTFKFWQNGFGCGETEKNDDDQIRYPWCDKGDGELNVPDNTPNLPDTPYEPDVDEPPQDNFYTDVGVDTDSKAYAVFEIVNEYRKSAGLSALTYDTELSRGAQTRAEEIKKLFSHTRPDGRRSFTVLDDIGYSYKSAGENIAYGQSIPESVMNDWMNSEGHRENILNANFTKIGIGVYESGGVVYWTQIFAS